MKTFLIAILSKLGYKIVKDYGGKSARSHVIDFITDNPNLFKGDILDIGALTFNLVKETYQNVTTFDIVSGCDVQGDAHKLSSYFNNKFDTICLFEVLEHADNPQKMLEEIKNTLKKGGTLVGGVPFMYGIHGEEYGDYWRFTRQGLQKLLKDFTNVEIHHNGNELKPNHYIFIATT